MEKHIKDRVIESKIITEAEFNHLREEYKKAGLSTFNLATIPDEVLFKNYSDYLEAHQPIRVYEYL